LLYALTFEDGDEEDEYILEWVFEIESPIFQILKINLETKEIMDIPINLYMEKDSSQARLFFLDEYIYADHVY
jgi:hypothetical protein